MGDEYGNSVGWADGWTDGTAVDSSVVGEFEGFSVHGKTPEAGDGFSDDDPLGATEGAVEGISSAILGVSVGSDDDASENGAFVYGWVGCPDPYAEASTEGIDVDEGDGLTMTTDDTYIVGNSVGDPDDEHQGTVV